MGGEDEDEPILRLNANYLIDNKLGIIVDAEGTRANRSEETAVTETMIARVAGRYDLSPKSLAADTAYGTGRLLRWLTDRDIALRRRSAAGIAAVEPRRDAVG